MSGDVFYTRKGASAHAEDNSVSVTPVAVVDRTDPQALADQIAEAITRNHGEYEVDRYYAHACAALVSLGIITKAQVRKIKSKNLVISYR